MQPLTRRRSPERQPAERTRPDLSSLSSAAFRLAAVFACAGAIQILAGWFVR